MNLAFYSTYCGTTKNQTFNPQPVEAAYPYFFISNNEEVLRKSAEVGYKPIFLQMEVSDDPVLSSYQAKTAKVLPHFFEPLTKYDLLFYKDDKISINVRKIENSVRALIDSGSSTCIQAHPRLSGNLLYEFAAAMEHSKYRSQYVQIVAYITEELKNGANLACQMYATGAILRNMRHSDTIKINNMWWEHLNRCGIECQISFNVIAQKFNSIILPPSLFN